MLRQDGVKAIDLRIVKITLTTLHKEINIFSPICSIIIIYVQTNIKYYRAFLLIFEIITLKAKAKLACNPNPKKS